MPGLKTEGRSSQGLGPNLRMLARELIEHGGVPLARRKRRIVALVGAGASAPVGIPTSAELKKQIHDLVIPEYFTESAIDEDLKETWNHGIERATLEELTQVACKLAPARKHIVEKLQELCLAASSQKGSLPPLLGYEILTHMVKHGFIDHIISMNFDEMLDETMQNEVGERALIRIINEKDTILPDEPGDYVSFLVKPHGTISSPLSLRFTRDNVLMFPREIFAFIKKHILPPPARGQNEPATLLVIGFSMQDLVIKGILRDAHLARIYRIDVRQPRANFPTQDGPRVLEECLARKERLIISRQGVNILDQMWGMMSKEAEKKKLTLVAIARHQILSRVFSPRKTIGAKRVIHSEVNPSDRLRAELLLAAAKAKGKFSTYNLARIPRINRYFGKAQAEELGKGFEIFRELVEGPEPLFTNEHHRHELTGESYYFDNFDDALRRLAELGKYPPVRLPRGLRKWYWQVRRGEEVEVERCPDPRNNWQFVDPRAVHTLAELHQVTRELLLNRRANRIFVICETGDWLRRRWVHGIARARRRLKLPSLTCEMITVFRNEFAPLGLYRDVHRDFAFKLHNDRDGPEYPICLHWWEHSRHLTLAARVEASGNTRFVGGIYLRRRLNMPLIHPVLVHDQRDLNTLWGIFCRYRRKHFAREMEVTETREAPVIESVLNAAFKHNSGGRPPTEKQGGIKGNLNRKGRTYLAAYYKKRPVGILSFGREGRDVQFSVVAVLPAWEECGVATMLMKEMEAQAGRKKSIRLVTHHRNVPFLRKRGYTTDRSRNQPRKMTAMVKRLP